MHFGFGGSYIRLRQFVFAFFRAILQIVSFTIPIVFFLLLIMVFPVSYTHLIDQGELPFHNLDYLFVPKIREAIADGKTEFEAYVVKDGALKPFTPVSYTHLRLQ